MRRLRALLVAAALAAGCSSTKIAEKRAFYEAGHEVLLRQPPPTQAEMKRDLDLFLENDVFFTFDKAKARESKQVSTNRIVFVGGMALGVIGGTAGSLKGNTGAQAALVGTGVAAMGWAAWRYFGPTKALHECQEFLSREAEALRGFELSKLSGAEDEPVPPEVFREYVDRVGAIRLHESCLVVR